MNCLIQVRGIATAESSDTTEIMTRGLCRKVSTEYGDGFRFDYRTADEDGSTQSTLTKVTVTQKAAIITRTGGLNSTITVVPGERHTCDYATAIGVLSFDIVGKNVSLIADDPKRIIAHLSYDICSGDSVMSSNEIHIIAEQKTE